MGILDGKVAIVTGAARGIGRGHARLLAAEGARVVVNDVERAGAEGVVADIAADGGEAIANTDNVARWEGGGAVIQQAIDSFGRLDILVNNAGILRDAMSFNISEELWDAVLDVHLKGHMSTCHAAANHWRERSLRIWAVTSASTCSGSIRPVKARIANPPTPSRNDRPLLAATRVGIRLGSMSGWPSRRTT